MQAITVDWDRPADPRPGPARDHVRDYAATGGQDGHLWHGVPTLLLTTVGRRTGRTTRTPLIYTEDEARLVVAAAAWGAPAHPDWYRNLTAHPEVRVQVGPDVRPALARTAGADEREVYWPALAGLWPALDDYQTRARPTRTIPLVVLDPARTAPRPPR
ncbi:nitroreductase/quinone reductase family protein [Streptomyces globosus]|jgi:deazaflavin-dependent oxidoreductase (nitroreductase family)|uniref:nitroreductase/quinone reductase family protein n=1 Tax=Streptomyces globosus TaxID=68209 RepID=UPI0031D44FFA